MTKNNRLKITEIIMLVLIWLVLLASPILFRQEETISWQGMKGPMATISPLFLLFLLNRFLLVPKILFRKKHLLYFLAVGASITILTLGIYFSLQGRENHQPPPGMNMDEQMHAPRPQARTNADLPLPPPPDENDHGGPIPPFANFLIFSILLVGFDTGLRLAFKLTETEREKAKLEKENSESQLAFLRNQVSPHFFMNTLNNIHSLIDFDTEEAKESIIRLSKLMRHLLYDSEAKNIPIQKEMDFISNYVDLMKLRYSEKVKINLEVAEQLPDKSIPPLLFTSFLENAFKHGISYQSSSFIDITVNYASGMLTFEILNSNAPMEEAKESYGIGIENSRKRLKLLYADNFDLKIEDRKDEYLVRLSIPV